MALHHESSQAINVAMIERICGCPDACNLIDDVTGTWPIADLRTNRIPEYPDTECARIGEGFLTSRRPWGPFESSRDTGVDHHESNLCGKDKRTGTEIATVQQHQSPKHRCHLILQSAWHPGREMLSTLRPPGPCRVIHLLSTSMSDRIRQRHLERRRRRQSTTNDEIAADGGIEPCQRDLMISSQLHNCGHQSAPVWLFRTDRTAPAKGDGDRSAEVSRDDVDGRPMGGLDVDLDGAIDGAADHRTFVEVDVSSDQIDPPGRPDRERRWERAHRVERAHCVQTDRSRAAASSGTTGFDNVPEPTSPAAR